MTADCNINRLNSLSFVSLLQAYRKLEALQKLLPSQNVRYYISQESLEALQKALGVHMGQRDRRDSEREEDEVEEDLSLGSHQGNWPLKDVSFQIYSSSVFDEILQNLRLLFQNVQNK